MQAKDISREILFLPLPFSISFKPKGWLVEHSWNVIRTNGRDEIAWKGSEVGEINGTCSGGDLREKYIRITRVCVATVDEDGIYGMPLFFLSFLPYPSLSINYNYRGCGIISRFRSTFANFNFVDVQSMVVYGMENNNSFLRSYFVIRVRIIFNFAYF